MSEVLRRVISIMDRRKLLPPRPQALRAVPIEIEYVSMFSLAQRAAQTASMERGIAMVGRMEGVWKGSVDKVNPNEFIDDYFDKIAFPAAAINSQDEVKKRQAARAQAQQTQEATANAAAVAPVAADTAKTLSETDTGQGLSALQVMLGQQPAPTVGAQ